MFTTCLRPTCRRSGRVFHRRQHDDRYPKRHRVGRGGLNLLSTMGAFLIALSVLGFMGNVFWSRRYGRPPIIPGKQVRLSGRWVPRHPATTSCIAPQAAAESRCGNRPPLNQSSAHLFYGTANTLVLLISAVPNQWVKRAAERQDLRRVRLGLLICLACAGVFLALRAVEFTALHCAWDTNAYGSVVWLLLGFHTFHLVTDVLDTAALTALMFTQRMDRQRFVDVSGNSAYWYFVVAVWIPIYMVIYLAPRLL